MASNEQFFRCRCYDEGSELHLSDQITVPGRIWDELYRIAHDGSARPLFVELGGGGERSETTGGERVVGRLRPAVFGDRDVDETGSEELVLLPLWMWLQLGAPDPDFWLRMARVDLPDAGAITLRPRRMATLQDLSGANVDPVAVLTEALTGGGGGPSWACLSAGAELPLAVGDFDIVRVEDLLGQAVPAACILNLDVVLELEPALDTPVLRPVTPVMREPSPVPMPEPVVATQSQPPASQPPASQRRFGAHPRGFVPFSGAGHRLS